VRPSSGSGRGQRDRVGVVYSRSAERATAFRERWAIPESTTDLATAAGTVTNAVYGFTSMLTKVMADEQPDHIAVAFDAPGGSTYRKELDSEYKAGRKETPDLFRSQLPLIHEVLETLEIQQLEIKGVDTPPGAAAAAQHLIDLGHLRIGHLAGQATVSTGVLRRKGYHAALLEAGIQADPDLVVESGFIEEGGAQAMDRLLSLNHPPSAIFAVTDMTAIGAYGAARKRGLRIPEDLAIVGYNDIPLAGRLIPGLTTVHVPIHEFGSVAARMLLEQIETGMLTPRRVVFAPQLVVRGSSVAGADEVPTGRPAQRSPAE